MVDFQVPLLLLIPTFLSKSKLLDIIQVGATYPYYIFIIHDDIITSGMFEDFLDAVDINNGRAMHSDEELGIELLFHLTDTIITQEISIGSH